MSPTGLPPFPADLPEEVRPFVSLCARERHMVALLCVAPTFTLEHAEAIIPHAGTGENVIHLAQKYPAVMTENGNGLYSVAEPLRSELLAGTLCPLPSCMPESYRASAEWLVSQGDIADAIRAFHNAARKEDLLRLLDVFAIHHAQMHSSFIRELAPLLQTLPWDVRLKRPLGYCAFLFQYLKHVSLRQGIRLTVEMEERVTRSMIPDDEKRKILGELALIHGSARFNDCKGMVLWFKKSHRLLRGPSRILSRDNAWNSTSPHIGFLYFQNAGSCAAVARYIASNVFYFTRVADGCGNGFGSIIKAELALESASQPADLKRAENAAVMALKEAGKKEQKSSTIIASFILARIALIRGNPGEAFSLMGQCAELPDVKTSEPLRKCLDMANSYLHACMGDARPLPSWMERAAVSAECSMHRGIAFAHIVRSKYMLAHGENDGALALARKLRETFSGRHLLCAIHAGIIEALGLKANGDESGALTALGDTIKTAAVDGFIQPFAEYGATLLPLLAALAEHLSCAKNAAEKEKRYLQQLLHHTRLFAENLAAARAVTDREARFAIAL